MPTQLQSVERAIAIAGSQRALAASLSTLTGRSLSEVNVSQWLRALREGNDNAPPQVWCEPIETLTEGRVRVEELRPNILWKRDTDGVVRAVIEPIEPTSTAAL